MYDSKLEQLVGRIIEKIFMNEDNLKFETDLGTFVFGVEGDCCSSSYFHDFIGVKKLLAGNPVVSVKEIELDQDDSKVKVNRNDSEEIAYYGYEIVTEDPQFGEVTSVFSFRNSSNGYYGGWMNIVSEDTVVKPQIKDDVLEAVHERSTN